MQSFMNVLQILKIGKLVKDMIQQALLDFIEPIVKIE